MDLALATSLLNNNAGTKEIPAVSQGNCGGLTLPLRSSYDGPTIRGMCCYPPPGRVAIAEGRNRLCALARL